MAVSGGCKFFDKNYALLKNGGSVVTSSNGGGANSIIDISRYTQWQSLASNDVTTETITITLSSSREITRIFLIDFNFKEFNIKYNNGGVFEDFADVIGVNGTTSTTINESNYAFNTAYYEFKAVTTNQIQIQCAKTQVANAQKFLTQAVITTELGTLQGFPRISPQSSRNETRTTALSKRAVVQKSYETFRIRMNFTYHPFQNDLDILENIIDREEPFLVYPCGGRTGTTYFKVNQKAWRLEDLFNMQTVGRDRNEFERGVYVLGFRKALVLEEHI